MTILLLGWTVSRFTCCGYHRIVIPTEVEGPAVSFPVLTLTQTLKYRGLFWRDW
jgi:hypothetical protein